MMSYVLLRGAVAGGLVVTGRVLIVMKIRSGQRDEMLNAHVAS